MNRGKGLTRTRMKVRRYSKEPTVDGDSPKDVKDELDRLIRVIVALRDEQCVTCPQSEGLEVGHLFKRGKEPVRWHLLNVAGQCPNCNSCHNDHPEFYVERFIAKHGEVKYAALKELSQSKHIFTYVELLSIRDGLRAEVVRLAG